MSSTFLSSEGVPSEGLPGQPIRLIDLHRADLVHLQGLVVTADLTPDPCRRYLTAHTLLDELAALALAVRTGRAAAGDPWRRLAHHAPELAEWAGYLSAIQPRREAADRGELPISDREADDLVRDAQTFAEAVGRLRVAPGRRGGGR